MNKKTNDAKRGKSIRLSPMALKVLEIERGGLSMSEYFEELMIANVKHARSREIIADYVKHDSRIQSMLSATHLGDTLTSANAGTRKAANG